MTPPEKTQEERIQAATEALRDWRERANVLPKTNLRELAEMVIEAADAPPRPKWPTDETVETFKEAYRSKWGYLAASDKSIRLCLREAMLSDRILKAAIEYGNAADRDRSTTGWRLRRAVNEAGL